MLVRCEWRVECELQWIVYSRWAGCLDSNVGYILSQNTYPKYQSVTYSSKRRNSSQARTWFACLTLKKDLIIAALHEVDFRNVLAAFIR
jgi:hypothetical protein